jgi:hypothetical protein
LWDCQCGRRYRSTTRRGSAVAPEVVGRDLRVSQRYFSRDLSLRRSCDHVLIWPQLLSRTVNGLIRTPERFRCDPPLTLTGESSLHEIISACICRCGLAAARLLIAIVPVSFAGRRKRAEQVLADEHARSNDTRYDAHQPKRRRSLRSGASTEPSCKKTSSSPMARALGMLWATTSNVRPDCLSVTSSASISPEVTGSSPALGSSANSSAGPSASARQPGPFAHPCPIDRLASCRTRRPARHR